MTVSFEFKGGRDIERAFEGLGEPRDLRRLGLAALRRGAVPIRDRAKELAPDAPETGIGNYLPASIKIGQLPAGGRGTIQNIRAEVSPSMVVTYVGIDGNVLPPKPSRRRKTKRGRTQDAGGVAAYSIAVEMGWRGRAPQPYMRGAYEQKAQAAIDLIGPELWKAIDKRARRLAKKALG